MNNILIFTPEEIRTLMVATSEADAQGKDFRVWWTGTGIEIKVGGGMWSTPIGALEGGVRT